MVGQNKLGKVIKTLLHDARIDGYFTGHSLRRTGTSRLCQAGVQKKLVREISGHRSDAIDTYQVTSHKQRKEISSILVNKPSNVTAREIVIGEVKCREKVENVSEEGNAEIVTKPLSEESSQITVTEGLKKQQESDQTKSVGEIINSIVEKTKKGGKTKIRIEIEIVQE